MVDKEFLIETIYDEEGNSTYAIHQTIGMHTQSLCYGIQFKQTAEWILDAFKWKFVADQGSLYLPKPTKGTVKQKRAKKRIGKKRDAT